MRDFDRFSKRESVRRMEQTSDAGIQISWLGTFCRLFVVLLFIVAFSWGAWKLSRPANIWTSHSEIKQTENDLRGIHRDAEKARKEMENPREVTIESLVYRALNDGYELTDDERRFVQSSWRKFIKNSNIQEDENLLFRLKMRHAEDGTIEDYPLEEWVKQSEERKKIAEKKNQEEELRQAMMNEVQDVVQKNGKAEEIRLKTENKQKQLVSERRSNREIVRDVVEEAKANIYSGKPIDETDSEEVVSEEEVPEEKNIPEEKNFSEEKNVPEEEKISDSKEKNQNE